MASGWRAASRYAHGFPTPSATVAVTDDGDVTSSPPAAVLAQEVFCVSQAASVEFSPHRMWRKSVGCQMQVPSWPRWRARTLLFSLPNHKGSHMDDASDPHGGREQRRRTDGVMRSATLLGWCCPPTEELSCQRKLLLLADWIRVPTCSWSRKRTSSNCSTLPSVCAVAHGSLPPREEELPRNSAKRESSQESPAESDLYHAHCVLTAAQPARRRDDTRKKKL